MHGTGRVNNILKHAYPLFHIKYNKNLTPTVLSFNKKKGYF